MPLPSDQPRGGWQQAAQLWLRAKSSGQLCSVLWDPSQQLSHRVNSADGSSSVSPAMQLPVIDVSNISSSGDGLS